MATPAPQVDAFEPIRFPEWKQGLAAAPLAPEVRERYRRTILTLLRVCKEQRRPASVELIRAHLSQAEHYGGGTGTAVVLDSGASGRTEDGNRDGEYGNLEIENRAFEIGDFGGERCGACSHGRDARATLGEECGRRDAPAHPTQCGGAGSGGRSRRGRVGAGVDRGITCARFFMADGGDLPDVGGAVCTVPRAAPAGRGRGWACGVRWMRVSGRHRHRSGGGSCRDG